MYRKTSWWSPLFFLFFVVLFQLTVVRPNSLGFEVEEENTTVSFLDEDSSLEEEGEGGGGGEEEETTTMTTTAAAGEEIFCPGKYFDTYQATYGIFALPRTSASVNGTRVVAACPHGAITVGAVLIDDDDSQNQFKTSTTAAQQDSAGLTSFCYLVNENENEDDQEKEDSTAAAAGMGIWKHEADDNLNKCREQITEELKVSIQGMTSSTEIMSIRQFKQAVPKLSALLRYSYKDYEVAQILMDGVSRLLEMYEMFKDPTFFVYKEILFDMVTVYTANAVLQPGEKVSITSNNIAIETVMFPEATSDYHDGDADAAADTENDGDDDDNAAAAGETEGDPDGSEISDGQEGEGETPITMKPKSYSFKTLHLPSEVVGMAMTKTANKKTPRLQLIAYSNQLFSHWGQDEKEEEGEIENSTDSSSGSSNPKVDANETEFTGIWRILSVQSDGPGIENLTEPIVYTLSVHQPLNNSQWACVYWDVNAKKWVSTGMSSITFPNGTVIQCETRSFAPYSAFSVLLEPIPPKYQNPGRDDGGKDVSDGGGGVGGGDDQSGQFSSQFQQTIHTHVLSILSSVGSALSMTGLAITVLTYALFRCLRKERSNRILLNLSVSLFGLHLMSLISTRDLWDGACLVPAFLLHYLLLSLLISVFVQPQSRFLLKRSLFAWGIPFLIVLICACSQPEVYTSGRGDWCIMGAHLNLLMYYCGYLGPAALMLAVNCFVFIRIVRVLCQQGANVRKQAKMVTASAPAPATTTTTTTSPEIKFEGFSNNVVVVVDNNGGVDWKKKSVKTTKTKQTTSFLNINPTQVKGAITVMVLLGVGWTLGFFAIGPFELVFRYLFCLCNAGQGVLIFLFRVLLHPQANRAWRRAVMRGFSSDSEFSSFGSSSRKSQAFASSASSSSSPSVISSSNSVTNLIQTRSSDPFSSSKLASTLASVLYSSSSSGQGGGGVSDEKAVIA